VTGEEFIEAVVAFVRERGFRVTLQNLDEPAGRRPDSAAVVLSRWWRGLGEEDRRQVTAAIMKAVDHSLFGMCCVLDGVSVIEGGPDKGNFELYYVRGSERVRLNDPKGEMLHDLYNWYSRDRFSQKRGDGDEPPA
jgi:hypothetical protein